MESKEQVFPQSKNILILFDAIEKKPADNVFKKIIDNIKEVNRKYIKPNCKSLFMQQTTQTMSNPCHL